MGVALARPPGVPHPPDRAGYPAAGGEVQRLLPAALPCSGGKLRLLFFVHAWLFCTSTITLYLMGMRRVDRFNEDGNLD